jgi:hypothetical protein
MFQLCSVLYLHLNCRERYDKGTRTPRNCPDQANAALLGDRVLLQPCLNSLYNIESISADL